MGFIADIISIIVVLLCAVGGFFIGIAITAYISSFFEDDAFFIDDSKDAAKFFGKIGCSIFLVVIAIKLVCFIFSCA